MARRWAAAAGLLAAAVLAGGLIASRGEGPARDRVTLASSASGVAGGNSIHSEPPAASRDRMSPAPPSLPATDPTAAPPAPLGSNELPEFELDERGNLMMGAGTRNQLERLQALNDREQAQALLMKSAAGLPPAAARQATDAFFAWQNYNVALARVVSPQQPVTDEAGALQQLDALHALRVQQFGPEVAQAFFGDEEATARRLLSQMQAQAAAGGSFEERAVRAQQQAPAASR